MDISDVAIEQARVQFPGVEFVASDLASFNTAESFDVIVLNSVIHFFGVSDAVAQTIRFSRNLTPDGVFVVTMTNDPKAQAIFRLLCKKLTYLRSIVWQEQTALRFSTTINRERPPFILALFRPNAR